MALGRLESRWAQGFRGGSVLPQPGLSSLQWLGGGGAAWGAGSESRA